MGFELTTVRVIDTNIQYDHDHDGPIVHWFEVGILLLCIDDGWPLEHNDRSRLFLCDNRGQLVSHIAGSINYRISAVHFVTS